MDTKICRKCKQEKPATADFFRTQNQRLDSLCRECNAQRLRGYYDRCNPVNSPDPCRVQPCSQCGKEKPITGDYFKVQQRRGQDHVTTICLDCVVAKFEPYYEAKRQAIASGNVGTKRCYVCKQEKPATSDYFVANRLNTIQKIDSICRECNAARNRAQYNANPDKKKAKNKKWYERNKERRLAKCREWYESNRERHKILRGRWYQENKPVKRALIRGYQAKKAKATPSWADLQAIKVFYREAERLTRETGIQHSVDHIDPLQNKLICGLHVEQNLQVISISENSRKHNKFKPYGVDANGDRYDLES